MEDIIKKIGVIERQFKSEDSKISQTMKKKLLVSYLSSIALISASTLINFLTLRKIRTGKIEASTGMRKTTYLFLAGFGSFGFTFYFLKQAYEEIPQERIDLRMKEIQFALEEQKRGLEVRKLVKTEEILSQIPEEIKKQP